MRKSALRVVKSEGTAPMDESRPGEPPPEGHMPRVVSKTLRFNLDKPDLEPEWERRLERFANAVLRGAGAGFCLRGGLHLASLVFVLAVRRRQKKPVRPRRGPTPLQDTLRFTSFLAAFAGIYTAVDEGIAALFGNRRTAKWRAAAAGAAAGPTLLLTGPKTRHTSLALYVLIRGIALLVRCGNKPDSAPLLRRLLAPTRWRHGDTALMCLSTSQIGYSWIMEPSTLPPAYISFLNRHGGAPTHYITAELAVRNAAGLPPGPLPALAGTPHEGFTERTPCGFLHVGNSCNQHMLQFLPQAYLRALPVYVPVYLLPALLVHRTKLVSGPHATSLLAKLAVGTARSSLFLALYCTLAWRGAEAGFQVLGTCTGPSLAATCWTAGLATLVEKKSRRMELAFYCLSRAVESFGLCLAKWGWVRRDALPRRLDVLLFSAATSAILHCYSDSSGLHRDVFRSKYLNVLDFILGNSGLERGAIKHVPSTGKLLGAAVPEGLARDVRRVASDLGTRLRDYSPPGSPRSDGSDRGSSFDRGLRSDYSQSLEQPPLGSVHLDADQGP